MAAATPDADRLLRRKSVQALLAVSRHTLARIEQSDDTFPRFFKLSPGVEVVRERDVRYWIALKELQTRTAAPHGTPRDL